MAASFENEVVVTLSCRVDDPKRGYAAIDAARRRTKEGCALKGIQFRITIRDHGVMASTQEVISAIKTSKFAFCPTCRLSLSHFDIGFKFHDVWSAEDQELPLLSEL